MKEHTKNGLTEDTGLEEAIVKKLSARNWFFGTVESCTGGLISHRITNLPGVSEVFWGSFVVYDNSAKVNLGTPPELISQHGAVSREVALSLAENGLLKMQTQVLNSQLQSRPKPSGFICVSTTGIAGPSGGSLEKPVGLCWMGLAISNRAGQTQKVQLNEAKNRILTKNQFAQCALEWVEKNL